MYRRNVQSFEKSDGSSWSNLSFSPPPLISLSPSPTKNQEPPLLNLYYYLLLPTYTPTSAYM